MVLWFQILVLSYMDLFLKYLIICDHLGSVVSATTAVYGISFNCSFCVWEQINSEKMRKTLLSLAGRYINLLLLCKSNVYFGGYISLNFLTFWRWVISVITNFSLNQQIFSFSTIHEKNYAVPHYLELYNKNRIC